jgi:nucleoid-associated protein YgaU
MAAPRGAPITERRWRQALPLVVWLGSLLVGVVLFHALGSGPLAPPPLTDPSTWGDWASARDPLVATVAVLRLVVLALAWYLVGVTTIGIVARLARAARLVRVADALTVPMVRRLLQGALGLGLATAMVGAATPAAFPTSTAPPAATASYGPADEVRLTRAAPNVDHDEVRLALAGADDTLTDAGAVTGDAVRLTRLGPVGPDATDEVRLTRVEVDGQGAPVPLGLLGAAAQAAESSGDEVVMRRVADETVAPLAHEVTAGESFWTIARDALAASGEAAGDDRIHGYWQRLVEHNRDVLDDPDNPDLIFPGQILELPPVDDGGARS